jgi:hypothetical protein
VGKVRFVILGLVLGIVIAVVFGSQGCGNRDTRHAVVRAV